MFYLVSYDIPDDKRRTKIAKTLKNFGQRVQYSVFECNLDTGLLDKLVAGMEKIISPDEDSVRVYALCAGCERGIVIMGTGEVTRDKDVYIL